ncbi:MAG TPA: hypothetical protein VGR27_05495 [Longimicrobiaceae bacterium]|nr:hypothetical protein [Longimicrobiaceae bacterium]
MYRIVAALSLLLIAACTEQGAGISPEVVRMREDATRDACISRELYTRAEESYTTLAELHGIEDPEVDPAEVLPPEAVRAAYTYAQVYHQHAELRRAAFAHVDSAFNHVRSAADSTRHIQAATNLAPRRPEAGTIEANVATAYARDHAAIRQDGDHRCNWDL